MGRNKNAASSKHSSVGEESTGKKNGSVNVKSMLKIDHLKSLSTWASNEVCIPSLGAFFGQRLGATAAALGVPPDPSLFPCQRCESFLQTGSNCTVRVVKIKAKVKRKHRLTTQNSVVYKCHFCSHENRKRGTSRGYMKELCPPKPKLPSKPKLTKCAPVKCPEADVKVMITDDTMSKKDEHPSSAITSDDQPVLAKYTPVKCSEAEVVVSTTDEHPLPEITSNDQAVVTKFTSVKCLDAEVNVLTIDDTATMKDEHPSSSITNNDQVVLTQSTPLKCSGAEVTVMSTDDPMSKEEDHPSPAVTSNQQSVSCPTTPKTKITTLLDAGKRKRNRSKSKKAAESVSSSVATDSGNSGTASRKRRRKSWTSLKEIAERNQQNYNRNLANLAIPLHL